MKDKTKLLKIASMVRRAASDLLLDLVTDDVSERDIEEGIVDLLSAMDKAQQFLEKK